ncbi:D-alanyl-D-alanine carboxypeptidase family protein [Brevibacillus sp. H7]|uniref:D-alanyl-D-alanine carboxypeptidase family protein n=1 Tax=Brevibacillus sp. H7 TaxID=3349138 RepID=UPI003830B4B9
MKKQRKFTRIIPTVLAVAVLGGCQYPQWEKLLPATAQTTQNPAPQNPPAETQPASPDPDMPKLDLGTVPPTLVLPPGATQPLPYAKGVTYKSSSPEIVSISEDGELTVSPEAATGEAVTVTVHFGGQSRQATVKVKPSLADTVTTVNGVPTVTNPSDLVVVVNKQRSLPADYVPGDLVEPNVPFTFPGKSEKRLLRVEAAKALEEMFARAKQENVQLYAVSGYRSYQTQQALYAGYVKTQGTEHASRYSAQSGKSEHQTGLAIDVSGGDKKTRLEEPFANTVEGKWLAKHAAEFGFIIRYPRGKEAITGYAYEPWHIRYVGKNVAKEIASRGITLEEYFMDAVPVSQTQSKKAARK